MARVVDQACEVGLDGVVMAAGPDLAWLTDYPPRVTTGKPARYAGGQGIQDGDTAVLDFSGLIDGYDPDTTRAGTRFSTKPGIYLSGGSACASKKSSP